MKEFDVTVSMLLLVNLDFRQTCNVSLIPFTAVLLLTGKTVAAHCGLFWLARWLQNQVFAKKVVRWI